MSRDSLRCSSPGRCQRGAALLTAMIIVTLVATLASSMVWQQWRAVQVESAERARTQSAWILSGALDWARLILKEDARNGGADHLGEPWAVPLAEARLSTFLAADKNITEDAPDAFLSGAITDAQARYNLTNLVAQGKVDEAELAALGRLCEATGVGVEVAGRIATGLLRAQAASDPTAPLMPRTVAQLAWLGVDAESLRLLAPYVVLLPKATPVNLNTASREVLVAAVKGLDLASAERLIQMRQRSYFKTPAEIGREVPAVLPLDGARLATSSSFFEVRGRLRLGDRVLEQTSLVERQGLAVVVLRRDRVASRDQPAS
ncbi:MAG: type II secretion system minor pseudopilin GspK [Pseudomonadota bacterium]|nr:type II secretion system minor pseudopilin GspK [Pseudomonadota bacterium]